MKLWPDHCEHLALTQGLLTFLPVAFYCTWVRKYKALAKFIWKRYLMTNHEGIEEFSKLRFLSWSVSLCIWVWYLLSLNMASAFCLLNVQHIPRSVGYIENMLEQFIFCPFHWQLFISPWRAFYFVLTFIFGKIKFQFLRVTISWFVWCCSNVKAWYLWVPQ